tara:strand:- start:242 stop:457 length:216 start_codon:yes stop_codon:yes gene_type:complete
MSSIAKQTRFSDIPRLRKEMTRILTDLKLRMPDKSLSDEKWLEQFEIMVVGSKKEHTNLFNNIKNYQKGLN